MVCALMQVSRNFAIVSTCRRHWAQRIFGSLSSASIWKWTKQKSPFTALNTGLQRDKYLLQPVNIRQSFQWDLSSFLLRKIYEFSFHDWPYKGGIVHNSLHSDIRTLSIRWMQNSNKVSLIFRWKCWKNLICPKQWITSIAVAYS